jgi:hypothetical protein
MTHETRESDKWFSSPEIPYPKEFNDTTLKMLATRQTDNNGTVIISWNDSSFCESSWTQKIQDWKTKYPNIVTVEGGIKKTIHETELTRRMKTSNKDIREKCWSQLKRVRASSYTGISRDFLEKFRIDMYGNIVCLHADNESISSFDVDHIFPWCRGGRSVQENFAAVQSFANRWIKSDNMVQWLDPNDMMSGVQENQLIAMVDFILNDPNNQRKDKKCKLTKLYEYLTASPPKTKPGKQSLHYDFQRQVRRSCDGEFLFRYFVRAVIEYERSWLPDSDESGSDPNAARSPTGSTQVPTMDRPRVLVHASGGVIACFGPNTYAVRNVLAQELRMTWDPEGKRWWQTLPAGPGESEKAVRGIRRALHPYGVSVEQLRPGPPAVPSPDSPGPECDPADAAPLTPPLPPQPAPAPQPPPPPAPDSPLEDPRDKPGGGAVAPPLPPTPVVGRNKDGSECGYCLKVRARLGAASPGCRRHAACGPEVKEEAMARPT